MENINTVFTAIREAVKSAITVEKTALTYRKNADGGLLDVIRANRPHLDDAGKSFFLQVYSDELAPAIGLKASKNKTGKTTWIGDKSALSVLKVRKSEVSKLIDAVTDPDWTERDDTAGYHTTLNAYRAWLKAKNAPEQTETAEESAEESADHAPTTPGAPDYVAAINALYDSCKSPGIRYDETAAILRLLAVNLQISEMSNDCQVLAGVLRNVAALVTLNDTDALEALLGPQTPAKRVQVRHAA